MLFPQWVQFGSLENLSRNKNKNPMSSDQNNYPKTGQAWYILLIVFLAYMFSSIDRQILTLMVEPVRADLSLSDFEMSLLQGLAFSMLYCIAALPLARLSDFKSRRMIIAAGATVWCLMTALCGFAKTFTHLFMARMGVGVGEAALGPAAASLISDCFPPEKRGFAFSVYHLGQPVGGGLALVIGGAILGALEGVEIVSLGLFGEFRPWQLAFIIVGLPGLAVTALMFSFKEPSRKGLVHTRVGESVPIPVMLNYMKARWQAYATLFSSVSLMGMLALGTAIWYPTFLIRTYGMSASEAGYSYGLILGICGVAGILTGGWLSQRLAARGYVDANMRVMLIAILLKTAPLIAGPLMPTATGALFMMAAATFIGQASVGVSTAAVQDITPNEMRAQSVAAMFLLVNILGIGLGATFIAAITDFVFGNDNDLRYSISLASLLISPLVAATLYWGIKHYRKCIQDFRLSQTGPLGKAQPQNLSEVKPV